VASGNRSRGRLYNVNMTTKAVPRSLRWWTAGLVLTGVATVAVGVTGALLGRLGPDASPRLEMEAARTGLLAGIGFAAVAVLILMFRGQRAGHRARAEELRLARDAAAGGAYADARVRRDAELASAVERLGGATPPVRLGGLYALERLAQERPEVRAAATEVLCGYLRLPYAAAPDGVEDEAAESEREVRRSVQRVLARHLTPAGADAYWGLLDLDLRGAVLLDADFAGVAFAALDARSAAFLGDADFDGASFADAARFERAEFTGETRFRGAEFDGPAAFDRVAFRGPVAFRGARLAAASFRGAAFAAPVAFRAVVFSGPTWFDSVGFGSTTTFAEASFGGDACFDKAFFARQVGFRAATFEGAAGFRGASFTGVAAFERATFAALAGFDAATFSGVAGFDDASFTGEAGFHGTTFCAHAGFRGVAFDGPAAFEEATFAREADFTGAVFGGVAQFRGATSHRPPALTGATATDPEAAHSWPAGWDVAPGAPGSPGRLYAAPVAEVVPAAAEG
jgi:uncharacterized protein YjbI with pentapeptide repeats